MPGNTQANNATVLLPEVKLADNTTLHVVEIADNPWVLLFEISEALCSFYEHNFLEKNPNQKFYGWRFMDDLLMCVPPSMDTSEFTNIYVAKLD